MKKRRLPYTLHYSQKESLIKKSGVLFLIVLLFFVTVSVLASSFFEKRFESSSLKGTLNIFSTEQLVTFMGTVNPYFTQVLPKSYEPPSLQNLSFELATSIRPGDIRSLLGRELPGFALFDTEIIVAGEGTDFTNLPHESAPPMDILLKEREIVEEKLNVNDEGGDPDQHPDQTTHGRKVVYLYQSHSYESFLPLIKGAKVPDDANTTNPKANMIAVGNKLAEELEQRGIGVQHNTDNMAELLHARGWNHNNAYKLTGEIVEEAMAQNDDIQFIFDLHRDSEGGDVTKTTIKGKSYARMLFIIGTEHKDYEKNLQLAKELNSMLSERYPGLSRGIFKKNHSNGNGVYNQDLSDNALLIEIGGVDNNLEELYRSAEAFADVFADYYWDAEKVDAGVDQ